MSILGNKAKDFLDNKEGLVNNTFNKARNESRIKKTDENLIKRSLKRFRNQLQKAPLAPLSSAQQRMWFNYELSPHHISYNKPVGISIKGELNEKVLEKSLQVVAQRQQILKTTFANVDGQLVQKVDTKVNLTVQSVDLSSFAYVHANEELAKLTGIEARRPFDLERGPLVRPFLICLNKQEHVLLLIMHNIIFDDASTKILLQELATVYDTIQAHSSLTLPPLPLQYSGYAHYQQDYIKQPQVIKQLDYWKEQLKGELPVLELPTDKLRPALPRFRGSTYSFSLDKKLYSQLKAVAEGNNTSLFSLLLSCFYTLLYRYSGQEDIIVGAPVYKRNLTGTENLIGLFRNMLPLRQQMSGDTSFTDLLQAVEQTTKNACLNQDIPFEKVVEEINPERIGSRPPLYQVLFQLDNQSIAPIKAHQLTFENYAIRTGITDFDLFLDVHEKEDGLTCVFEYDIDLFNQDTIERMAAHYATLAENMVADPDQKIALLNILPQAERNQLLIEWNKTKAPYPVDKCVHHLFEEQVEKTPQAVALVFEDSQLTYHELNQKANQLAHFLQIKGVKQDTLVPICINRSLEMIVGLLGILKAGAAFVPVDPAFPRERIQFMLEDTASDVVVSTTACAFLVEGNEDIEVILLDKHWELISKQAHEKVNIQSDSHHLAYSIFTSGSTGRPKGVMIRHQSLVNFLFSMIDCLEVKSSFSLLSVTTFSFDIFYLELFMPILTGGKVILASRETASDGYLLQKKLAQHRPSFMQATPATWQMLIDGGWKNEENTTILLGGEAIREALKESLTKHSPKVWNLYGPTETTIWSTYKELKLGEKITIGRPIANTQIYILDKAGNPVPIGVPGELCIGGDGLARGYLKRDDLTSEKFIPDNFSQEPDAKIYKTGDLARWLSNGELEYLSRLDDQVKIRGYRIELGEVENVLQKCAAVQKGVVVAKADASGSKRLVGYIIPEGVFNKEEILTELRAALPEYMVPSVLVALEAFPLTPNGKVNKKALPEPKLVASTGEQYVAPTTEAEQILADIWAKILGQDLVGVQDNFFELGGHSLLAVKLFSEIRNRTGKELPISTLYANPVIAKLAKHIEGETDVDPWNSLVTIRTSKTKLPIYFIHHGGGNLEYAQRLALFLDKDQAVYGLQPVGLNGVDKPLETIEEMAAYYTDLIIRHQPEGPYHLAGYSTGGLIAYHIAKRLTESGKKVGNLFSLNTYPSYNKYTYRGLSVKYVFINFIYLLTSFKNLQHFSKTKSFKELWDKLFRKAFMKVKKVFTSDAPEILFAEEVKQNFKHAIRRKFLKISVKAEKNYRTQPYPGPLVFIRAIENHARYVRNSDFGWRKFVKGKLTIYDVPENHDNMFDTMDDSKRISRIIQKHLNESNNPLVY